MNGRGYILDGGVTGNSEITVRRIRRPLRGRGYDPVLEDMARVGCLE